MHYITKDAIVNENNINQIEVTLPSNVEHNGYINGTFLVNGGGNQIVYSPFKLPIDDILPRINTAVIKNVNNSDMYKAVSIHSSIDTNQNNLSFTIPRYTIFDKFSNNLKKVCDSYYPLHINGDNGAAIIIKDNWYIRAFTGLNEDGKMGIDIIIDDFTVNKSNSILGGAGCISNVIINNTKVENMYNFLESLSSFKIYKPNRNSILYGSNRYRACTIIFTTTCKISLLCIPQNRSDYDNPLFIILPNKIEKLAIATYGKIAECGNTVIVTIPDNYDIINNYSGSSTDNKPISELDNIHINTTLNVKSYYDKKGLTSEYYYYTHDNEEIMTYFTRTDTPIIG